MALKSKNIVYHHGAVTLADRERILGQRGCVVWFTGLSGAGKSTVARALEKRLATAGRLAYVLDGDNLRHRLNRDLGFSPADREENIRRVGEVAALFAAAGIIAITAFISPYRKDRARVRDLVGAEKFVEVFLDVPIGICEQRDPKGLYRRARAGEIPEFTGISAPYEPPADPALTVPGGELDLAASVEMVWAYLAAAGFLSGPAAPPQAD